ncbi:MAG TPA: TRAP transporter substrate-binding protein DctP [Casimicrobiaceae bacterium]|nr:TRAP transporter substrate-binding protein DctP [Casimicrobiaceae bacterium]
MIATIVRLLQSVANALLVAQIVAIAPPALAQSDGATDPLKLSVATGPAMSLGKAAERWSELLTQQDARLATKIFPGAMLARRDPAREFLALKEGDADLAVGSALQWSTQVPSLAVFSLPWLAPQDSDLEALASDTPLRLALAQRVEAGGAILLAVAPLGHLEIATVSRAIRSPEDLKGLKLRAPPAPLLQDLLLALGALPQSMSFKDAQEGFARGELDGQQALPTVLAAARAGAIGQRHLTDWGAVGDAMLFAVRKNLWDRLDVSQRALVRRSAEEVAAKSNALAGEAAAVEQLARNGVAVVRITRAGHAVFRTNVAGIYARWRDAIGADIVTLAESALAMHRPHADSPAPRK